MKSNKKATLVDLKNECKRLGLKMSGTRGVLTKRIQTATFLEKKCQPLTIPVKEYKPTVYQQIIPFQKYYSFLFQNNVVVGKLDIRNDKESSITKEDIEYCKFHKIAYSIPAILEGEEQRHRVKEILEESDDDDDLN